MTANDTPRDDRVVDLHYGEGTLPLRLPEGCAAEVIQQEPCPAIPDVADAVRKAIEDPILGRNLRWVTGKTRTACILISDKTRPVPNAEILPPLLHAIESAGIRRDDILILVATGLHAPTDGEDLRRLVGDEILYDYRVENHNWQTAPHVFLGETEAEVSVDVDKRYFDADFKVATGLIEPHLLAGYSGGRKAVCPGICSVFTLRVAHGPYVIGSANARPGVLEGNLFHETAVEAAQMAGIDFLVNVTINRQRQVTGVFAGDMVRAHEAGVAFCDTYTKRRTGGLFDIVVTTGGGAPLDRTFYQSVKGAAAAYEIVKPGGAILLAAQCGDGVGSESFHAFLTSMKNHEQAHEKLFTPGFFKKDQWMVQHLCHVLERAKIAFYSDGLPRDEQRKLFVEPVDDVSDALASLARPLRDPRIAILPDGPYVLAVP